MSYLFLKVLYFKYFVYWGLISRLTLCHIIMKTNLILWLPLWWTKLRRRSSQIFLSVSHHHLCLTFWIEYINFVTLTDPLVGIYFECHSPSATKQTQNILLLYDNASSDMRALKNDVVGHYSLSPKNEGSKWLHFIPSMYALESSTTAHNDHGKQWRNVGPQNASPQNVMCQISIKNL